MYYIIKRVFDILFGLIGLLLMIPIAIIVKICYLLNKDTSNIFYVQLRVGKNGKGFRLYKFRTMIPNAEEELKKLLKEEKYRKQWERNQKLDYDPRITKVGKVLRKFSLDEMPQFINVLIGNMSLIGPRPLVKGELINHNGNVKLYESVKPGITGWWACNGSNGVSYQKRLELEYYYVNNISLVLDVKCILKTIMVVIKGKEIK